MNKMRRYEISKLIGDLKEIQTNIVAITNEESIPKISDDLNTCLRLINDVTQEEESYMDNIPENLQGSQRYYDAEDAVAKLESAADYVDDAISTLDAWELEGVKDAEGAVKSAIDQLRDAQM